MKYIFISRINDYVEIMYTNLWNDKGYYNY